MLEWMAPLCRWASPAVGQTEAETGDYVDCREEKTEEMKMFEQLVQAFGSSLKSLFPFLTK